MSRFLDEFEKNLASNKNANVFFAAEYKDGQITSRAFAKTNPCQNIYSVAKVYVVTAIGILCDRGLLSTDEKLTDILADELCYDFSTAWKATTVDDLLLHKVALSPGFLDIDCLDATGFGCNYLKYVMTAPISESFNRNNSTYTDAAYYLLSRIIEKRSGMGTDNFLHQNLLYPTQCKEAAFSHCPMGHTIGATGIYIRAEDMAKLGAVYLSGGVYNRKRIISQAWCDTVFSKGYELHATHDKKGYCKGGMRGQMLLLIPSSNRVIALQGCGDNDFLKFCLEYAD